MTNAYHFAYCVPPDSAANRRWCIRKVSGLGLKLRGPIDTKSLCGKVKPANDGGTGGHDYSQPVDSAQQPVVGVCGSCLAAYREAVTR